MWISRSTQFPGRSFECWGLRLLTRNLDWNRENVFDMYGDSSENLFEIVGVVIILSLISSARGLCWLCVDSVLTLCWLCVDSVLTLCWLCVDFVLTLCWLCVDLLLILCQLCVSSVWTLCVDFEFFVHGVCVYVCVGVLILGFSYMACVCVCLCLCVDSRCVCVWVCWF